jgi:hypothetical protein
MNIRPCSPADWKQLFVVHDAAMERSLPRVIRCSAPQAKRNPA